jgi:hypothetical protein
MTLAPAVDRFADIGQGVGIGSDESFSASPSAFKSFSGLSSIIQNGNTASAVAAKLWLLNKPGVFRR